MSNVTVRFLFFFFSRSNGKMLDFITVCDYKLHKLLLPGTSGFSTSCRSF